jgi:hypothetical protein
MSPADEYKRKRQISPNDIAGGGSDDSEKGGKSGQIEFHSFLSSSEGKRDDLLSGEEKRHLFIMHESVQEAAVKKQKEKRDKYDMLKKGKISLPVFRESVGSGMGSQFKNHPAFANSSQFTTSTDSQVNSVPNENAADTNLEKREELQYQYTLANRPQNAPRYSSPRPNPLK